MLSFWAPGRPLRHSVAPGIIAALRTIGWMIVAGGAATTASVALNWLNPIYPLLDPSDRRAQLALTAIQTDVTPVFALGAGGLILARWLYRATKSPPFAGLTRRLFILAWRQHDVLGWMVLALGGGHALYFVIYPRVGWVQWSGVAAMALLVAAALLGLKTRYGRRVSFWTHAALGAAFLVVFFLHVPDPRIMLFRLMRLF